MANPDSVFFNGVAKNYLPGEKLEVAYTLHEEMAPASRDWVGLFRVGWSSSRDYYTFEWAPAPVEMRSTVVFAGRRLPPEDKHFYQFCYVSSDGRVRGASSPFQFSTAAAASDHRGVDDLELVEVSEDSLIVLQPKESIETVEREPTHATATALEEELATVKESFVTLETEKEVLLAKCQEECEQKSTEAKELEEKVKQVGEKLKASEEKVNDLEQQLQAKRESENRLMEKLEKERALVHELTTTKSGEEAQLRHYKESLVELEATATAEREVARQQLAETESRARDQAGENRVLVARLEEVGVQLDQLKDVQVQLISQIGEKNEEIEQSGAQLAGMRDEFAEEYRKACEEKEQLLQELTVAQANIAELCGAKRAGIEIEVPSSTGAAMKQPTRKMNESPPSPSPPTLPPVVATTVDKSAYEALQQAYDNVEETYGRCFEENRELRALCHERKAKLEERQVAVAHLTHRIEKCRVEYEAKCKELHDAKKQSSTGADTTTAAEEVAVLQRILKEMEENQEQIVEGLDKAVKELASRRSEVKEKSLQVAQAEEKCESLEKALGELQLQFDSYQDKHDRTTNTRQAKLDEQEDVITVQLMKVASLGEALCIKERELVDVKQSKEEAVREALAPVVKEKAKLEQNLQHMKEQLQVLKQQARGMDRSCPVCNTKFPGRISQQDFEKHVQGHFT